MGRQWRPESLEASAWRPPPGLSGPQRSAEQDLAAGGRDRRLVRTASGETLASVYFRRPSGRRVYGYLRWSDQGRTVERFVCEVDAATRAANLAQAWRTAHQRGLLTGTATRP